MHLTPLRQNAGSVPGMVLCCEKSGPGRPRQQPLPGHGFVRTHAYMAKTGNGLYPADTGDA